MNALPSFARKVAAKKPKASSCKIVLLDETGPGASKSDDLFRDVRRTLHRAYLIRLGVKARRKAFRSERVASPNTICEGTLLEHHVKVTEHVQACSTKLPARRETRAAVRDVRQETSEEGLGWSKLLQQECDYHFCAGVEDLAFVYAAAR